MLLALRSLWEAAIVPAEGIFVIRSPGPWKIIDMGPFFLAEGPQGQIIKAQNPYLLVLEPKRAGATEISWL